MIKKLKELPLLSATFVLIIVFAVGAFTNGCGSPDTDDHSDDSTAAGADDHDETEGDGHEEDEGDGHADVGESDVSADSFGDVAAVWGEVMTLKAELDGLIDCRDCS